MRTFITTMTTTATAMVAGLSNAPTYACNPEPMAAAPVVPLAAAVDTPVATAPLTVVVPVAVTMPTDAVPTRGVTVAAPLPTRYE